jgi:hypothetical protein
MDAIPKRIIRGLQVLKARFLGENTPLLEPTICQISKEVIDLDAPQESRREVLYFGYDIEDNSALQALLLKENGEEHNITNRLLDHLKQKKFL